jgi:ribose 5-phosphate isomerase RpiB
MLRPLKVAIGSDHAGFEYKEKIRALLSSLGHEVRDFGMRWRLCIFQALVALQKRTSKIAPKLTLIPKTT